MCVGETESQDPGLDVMQLGKSQLFFGIQVEFVLGFLHRYRNLSII